MQKNLFKFGENNKNLVDRILLYIEEANHAYSYGLCSGVYWGDKYWFFKNQPPFKLNCHFPVDAAVQKIQKKSIEESYYSNWNTNPKKAITLIGTQTLRKQQVVFESGGLTTLQLPSVRCPNEK